MTGDGYASALGRLVMEAATMERQTTDLALQMHYPEPYENVYGTVRRLGRLSRICDLITDKANERLTGDFQREVLALSREIRDRGDDRNEFIHASWVLSSSGGTYMRDRARFIYAKKGVIAVPTSVSEIDRLTLSIKETQGKIWVALIKVESALS